MGQKRVTTAALAALILSLAGCGAGPDQDGNAVTRALSGNGLVGNTTSRNPTAEKISAESAVIQDLMGRRSALPGGGPYDEVASAVLAANSRAAEAELRAAKLRAQAASKNWLPRIGPDISLTSLGSIAASLILDATLFDHGRKKAERAFAAADVEVAAVSLAEDSNDRVFTALELYLAAERGREAAAVDQATLKDMNHFLYIITERVKGGVSDQSELNVIRQKVAEIRSSSAENQEAARTALSELNAMAAHPVDGIRGLSKVGVSKGSARALVVARAEATKTRDIARAKVDRANALPGITAQASIGDENGASISTDGSFGPGSGAQLRAIAVATETAERNLTQAKEDAARQINRLESQIAAKERQAAEAAQLAKAARANLDLFQEQFDAGQRPVMDVVQVYETFARNQQRQIDTKYEAAAMRLDLARVLGLLADGEAI